MSDWHYALNGKQKGPVNDEEMRELIKDGKVDNDTTVWREGMPEWEPISKTRFNTQFKSPPPLKGDSVNNTMAWLLGFSPIIGLSLEYILGGAIYGETLGYVAAQSGEFLWVHFVLVLSLAFWDVKRLQKAGHTTKKYGFWFWFLPVYLFQRSKHTHTTKAYFWVYISLLVLFILADLGY